MFEVELAGLLSNLAFQLCSADSAVTRITTRATLRCCSPSWSAHLHVYLALLSLGLLLLYLALACPGRFEKRILGRGRPRTDRYCCCNLAQHPRRRGLERCQRTLR